MSGDDRTFYKARIGYAAAMVFPAHQLVLVQTDGLLLDSIVALIMPRDTPIAGVQITLEELPLYREYQRMVVMEDPLRRLRRSFALYKQADPESFFTFDDYIKDIVPDPEFKFPENEQGRQAATLTIPQWAFFCVYGVYEIDIILNREMTDVWLPMIKRRFQLGEASNDFTVADTSDFQCKKSTLLQLSKLYAEDYVILKDMEGGRPYYCVSG